MSSVFSSSSSSGFGAGNGEASLDTEALVGTNGRGTTSSASSVPESQRYCGCGRFHPRFLQWFARPTVYTFLLCLFVLVESCVVSGLSFVAVSTVEARYHISSTAMGVVLAMFDVSIIASVLFVSYFGGHGYRGRWLAVGELVMGIGCLIFAAPEFLFNSYQPEGNWSESPSYEICFDVNGNSSDTSSFHGFAYAFFFVGQLVIGVGTTPLYTVGISYLDELVLPQRLSIHLSAVYMVSTLGPALGFGLGGAFLSVYIDPWQDTGVGRSDPSWLGAWWLGFVIFGLASVGLSTLFFAFPRTLANEAEVRRARMSEHARKGGIPSSEEQHGFVAFLGVFVQQMRRLMTNVTFLFLVASVATLNMAVGVIVPFASKYVETQFYVSPSIASLMVGVCCIGGAGLGVVFGGVVMCLFKDPRTKARRMALHLCVVSGLAVPFLLGYLVHCPSIDVVGIGNESMTDGFPVDCGVDCGCSPSLYWPVCGSNGLTYASPCFAGCTEDNSSTTDVAFANCSCVGGSSLAGGGGSAVGGACDGECQLVGVFLLVLSVAVMLEFMRVVPFVVVTLRSVRDEERPLSLGVVSALSRLLGTIPGPILGGLVFDSACRLWQEEDGVRGNCWLYDNEALYTRTLILVSMALTLSFIASIGVFVTYPKNISGDYAQPDSSERQLEEIIPSSDE